MSVLQTASSYHIELLNGNRHKLCGNSLKIIFIIKDHARLEYGIDGASHTLKATDILVLNSYEPFLLVLSKSALAICLEVSPEFIFQLNPEYCNWNIKCKSFLPSERSQETFDELRKQLAVIFQMENKSVQNSSSGLEKDILSTVKYVFEHFNGGVIYNSVHKKEIVQKALDYILENFTENISLDDLADYTYLNKTYISHCFRECLGISFYEYLTTIRLIQAEMFLYGGKNITEIAYECGFPNVNAITYAFRKYRGMTPREYRKQLEEVYFNQSVSQENVSSFTDAMSIIEKYAGKWEDQTDEKVLHDICVDLSGETTAFTQNWKRIINIGFAHKLLEKEIQREVIEVQKSIGFQYIRCKGILDDDMYIYTADYYDIASINFAYLDDVIDFILSVNAKPMLEFGSMPSKLAARRQKGSMRPTFLSPPKDEQEWERLVTEIVEHLVKRYGSTEIESWLFSPWYTIDNIDLLTEDEYFRTYQISYHAIKNANPRCVVCGPGCAYHRKYLPLFIQRSKELHCVPDIITIRSSSSRSLEEESDEIQKIINNELYSKIISEEENLLALSISDVRELLNREKLDKLPIFVEEWTGSSWPREVSNDTCYKAAYIFKNILENYDSVGALAYYALNDRLDELVPSKNLFCGGFGLYTANGLPKSALEAMKLLAKMQPFLLLKGNGYFITRNDRTVTIFLYNYCHYDIMYRLNHTENLPDDDRYKVFVKGNVQVYNFFFNNMRKAVYKIQEYRLQPGINGAFDAWVKIGSPDPISPEEYELITHMSVPSYRTVMRTVEGEEDISLSIELVPHEVAVIQIAEI